MAYKKGDPVIDFSPSFKIASFFVFHFTLMLVKVFDLLVFSIRIKGRKNLYPERAFLVSNHVLYLDPGIIAHTIRPRRTYFSALEKTNLVPGLGTYISLLGAFKEGVFLLSFRINVPRP